MTPVRFEELQARMGRNDLVLFDVLPWESFRQAHLPGAVCLPVEEIESALATGDPRLPKDRSSDIVVYCAGPT